VFTVTGASGCANGGSAASLLTGDYAFGGQGFTGENTFTTVVGRFHADGVNTTSNGLIQENKIGSGATSGNGLAFTGCFALNTPAGASSVALGTLTLANTSASPAINLSIVIRANGNGNFIPMTPHHLSCPASSRSSVRTQRTEPARRSAIPISPANTGSASFKRGCGD